MYHIRKQMLDDLNNNVLFFINLIDKIKKLRAVKLEFLKSQTLASMSIYDHIEWLIKNGITNSRDIFIFIKLINTRDIEFLIRLTNAINGISISDENGIIFNINSILENNAQVYVEMMEEQVRARAR